MERCLQQVAQVYPGRAVGLPHFSEAAAHLLLAAADYMIVPSRHEPCGLVARYAQRYGALPIVTPVGGLRDIVSKEVGSVPYLPSAFSFMHAGSGWHEKPACTDLTGGLVQVTMLLSTESLSAAYMHSCLSALTCVTCMHQSLLHHHHRTTLSCQPSKVQTAE